MYEVSHIVAEKASGSSVQYLVRWVGYGVDDDTWQRESDLVDGAEKVLEEWKSTKERIMRRVEEFQLFGARLKHGYSVPMREVSKVKYMW
ncbi:hypothetical protein WOLCODRAFT_76719 [Wolfiporia cocos MD-104 SS10]|uniref:Chromo domain-containing protein n=1 Tax=Wolfiporia cocos (strain MD-104) TaxID=742152 RepID=A0A2H3JQP9_WOLCO|nr:hypothetical protein WOLCODRAFT_76719 [Wolfiporia cocos MD-104 SS10]